MIDYSAVQSLPEIWDIVEKECEELIALQDPHVKPEVKISYRELNRKIKQFAAGLQGLGVKPASKVALFADNSPNWFIADQGIMTAGCANAVRSSAAEKQELLYILQDSESSSLVVEDLKTLTKLRPELDELPIESIVLLSSETLELDIDKKILNFPQILELGAKETLTPVAQNHQTLATLIYTSGTTGQPKGAMLSHGNLLHQINTLGNTIAPEKGACVLSILPSWHSYERTCEYFLLSQGCRQIYTNIRMLKKDLKEFQPEYTIAVPRLWESIYEGIQKQLREKSPSEQKLIDFFFGVSEKYIQARRIAENLSLNHLNAPHSSRLLAKIQASLLQPIHALGEKIVYSKIREATGGKLKTTISGGGSLAKHLDDFYEIINIPLLVGYGLTETSPVATVRSLKHNLKGSAGQPIAKTEIKIVDAETRKSLPPGEKGIVLIRGPQVMQGYYRKPEATAKAIDAEGWFDSGDIGMLTVNNDLILTGRAKDTIVLTNGENIEPQPIEDACLRSPYIDQIMLVGQDQRQLGAIIVPNLDALEKWALAQQLNLQLPQLHTSMEESQKTDLYSKVVQELFRQELNREVQNRPGYRADDRIGPFSLILEPLSIDNGMMTQTLKIKRPVVQERYFDLIAGMFAKQ